MLAIVVWTGSFVSGDVDPRDASVLKHYPEEGEAAVTWRRWDRAAEEDLTVDVEVSDGCTAVAIMPSAGSAPIWLVDICEYRAKTGDCSCGRAIAPGRHRRLVPADASRSSVH